MCNCRTEEIQKNRKKVVSKPKGTSTNNSNKKPINNKNNNPQLQSINKKKEIKKNEIPKQIINQNENNNVQNLDIKNENHVQTMPLENINNMNYYNKQNIIIPSKPKVEQIDENEGPHFSEGLFLSKLVKSRIYNIDEMSKDQEQFKSDLNYLLEKLNEILTQHGELLYKKDEEETMAQIEQLNYVANLRRKDIQTSKNQNKIFKEQYELLNNKYKATNSEKIDEIEVKLEEMKLENHKLTKEIRDAKNKQNVKAKVLENYSANIKYPREIQSYTEEVKTLSNKKHDYYLKLNTNKKSLVNVLGEFERADKLYKESS